MDIPEIYDYLEDKYGDLIPTIPGFLDPFIDPFIDPAETTGDPFAAPDLPFGISDNPLNIRRKRSSRKRVKRQV